MSNYEFDMQSGISRTKKLIRDLARPVLIAVAGWTCSGKSFFSEKLAIEIGKEEAVSIIFLDNYFKDFDDICFPKNEKGNLLFDVPYAYLQEEFLNGVNLIMSGIDTRMPDYDIKTNKRISKAGKFIKAEPLIICEGLFTINMLSRTPHKVIKIFIDTDAALCFTRRINRDTNLYGVSNGMVEWTFRTKVLPYSKRFVEPQKCLADVIVKNDFERR
ncbi:MAG: hypothetical protein KJ737_04545 [Proteobacteria bacterium]|nr:hypothetical protein [Pseudomonadota bacterium]